MRHLILLCVVFAGATVAAAHQRQTNSQGQAVFRSTVETVEIDAVVFDGDGKAVHGLTMDDFTVVDRKTPVPMTSFQEINHDYDAKSEVEPPVNVPRDVATNTTPRAARLVVLVVDDTVPNDRMSQIVAVSKQVLDAFGDDASMSLLTATGAHKVEVTDDRAAMLSMIDKLGQRSAQSMNVARTTRVETGVCAFPLLINLADQLRSDDTQRKAVVYISPYCDADLKEVVHAMDVGKSAQGDSAVQMIDAFRRTNVAFYTVDPRGPQDYSLSHFKPLGLVDKPWESQEILNRNWRDQCTVMETRACDPVLISQDNMRAVTEATGGFAVTNTADIEGGIARIEEDFDHYYLLAFDATDPTDKSYRKVTVAVNHPGYTIRYRHGYQLGLNKSVAKNADPMVQLSTGVLPHTDLPLHLQATPLPSASKPTRVALALEVGDLPVASGTPLRDHLDVTVIAANLDNSKVAGEFLRPRDVLFPSRPLGSALTYQVVTTVPLPPGQYQLRVSARSTRLGKAGSVYAVVDVPDYGKTPISIGALVLGYADMAHHPVGSTLLDPDTLPLEPVLDRTFARADSLRVSCQIWRRDPTKRTTTQLAVVDATGKIVGTTDSEQAPGKVGDSPARVDLVLDLRALPPGAYELRAAATDGKNNATRSLGLVVR